MEKCPLCSNLRGETRIAHCLQAVIDTVSRSGAKLVDFIESSLKSYTYKTCGHYGLDVGLLRLGCGLV